MSQILGYLQSAWDFLSGIVKALYTAVEFLGGSILFLNNFIGYLPAIVSAGVIIFLAVYLVRFLLLK